MGFLDIGKIRGVLFSAIIIAIYYWYWLPGWHYYWFGFYPIRGWGTNVVLTGLVMTQLIIIQPGDTARLTFFGGVVNREWYNGLAFMPNIFHTTIVMFKFAILWGLAVLRNDTYKRYEEPDVRVDINNLNFNYQANVSMTRGEARRSQAIDYLWKIFWDYKRVPEEYYVASFGYRVLMVGIIMVCINSSATVANMKLNAAAASISKSLQAPAQKQAR